MIHYVFQRLHAVILVVLCVIILVGHTLYVVRTYQYPEMDEHLYMGIAVEYYRLLQDPSWDTVAKMNQYLVDHPPFRPPFYPLTITVVLLFTGLSYAYKVGLWVNGIYYILTIFGIYFLGKEFLSKTASFISSILFAFYGWTLFYLHFTYSETATTTFVVFSLLFLLKSNYFQNRKFSILFGITFALGILTRWVVPIFIAGPFIYVIFHLIKSKQIFSQVILGNIGLSFLIVFAPILFHLINGNAFGSYFFSQFFYGPLWELVPSYRRSFFSLQSAAYYFKVFEQLTIYLFVLFLIGLLVSLKNFRKLGILFVAFLIPYIAFSFGTVIKDDRYIVPIYPVVALISATLIDRIKIGMLRTALIVGIILISVGNFFGASWGVGLLGQEGLKSVLYKLPFDHPRRIHLTTLVWPPTKNFSNAQVIIDLLEEDIKKEHLIDPLITPLFSYHPLDNALYSINTYQREEKLRLRTLVGMAIVDKKELMLRVREVFKDSKYLLVKTGKVRDNYFSDANYSVIDAINRGFSLSSTPLTAFARVKEVAISLDKSSIIIYRKKEKIEEKMLDDFTRTVL